MTNFHPDEQWLSEYVAGTLADSQALCVSTHLAFCNQCKKETTEMTLFCAALFNNQQTDGASSPTALQQILSDIDINTGNSHTDHDTQPTSSNEDSNQLPKVIQKLIPGEAGNLRWRKIGSKISIAKLDNLGDKREITLHKLQPGSSVSDHDHRGREVTVVLHGSFSDDEGQYYPGDFLVREPGETHQPKVNNNEECLCLAVCDAPVKFTGLFTRLLNPLIAYKHNN